MDPRDESMTRADKFVFRRVDHWLWNSSSGFSVDEVIRNFKHEEEDLVDTDAPPLPRNSVKRTSKWVINPIARWKVMINANYKHKSRSQYDFSHTR